MAEFRGDATPRSGVAVELAAQKMLLARQINEDDSKNILLLVVVD